MCIDTQYCLVHKSISLYKWYKFTVKCSLQVLKSKVFFSPLKGGRGTNITIKVLCGLMADTSLGDPYARYAAVAKLMMDTFSIKCLDARYTEYLSDMTNTSWEGAAAGGGMYCVSRHEGLELLLLKTLTSGDVFSPHVKTV